MLSVRANAVFPEGSEDSIWLAAQVFLTSTDYPDVEPHMTRHRVRTHSLRRNVSRALCIAVLLVAPVAGAWDPSDAASVGVRRAELREAWKGKTASAVLADKLLRARQPRPKWVGRVAWVIEEGEKRLYFGVGSSHCVSLAAMQIMELRELAIGSTSSSTLDWYCDARAGVLYTLAEVDGR
jgi:hypothetical protein